MKRLNSIHPNSRIFTDTGWKISKIGVSPDNYGGDIGYQPGTTNKGTWW
jgi:hypothetical protein